MLLFGVFGASEELSPFSEWDWDIWYWKPFLSVFFEVKVSLLSEGAHLHMSACEFGPHLDPKDTDQEM